MCGKYNVIIGIDSNSDFDNCVIVGHGIESTDHNQLIIGNKNIQATRELTNEEYVTIRDAILSLTGTDESLIK